MIYVFKGPIEGYPDTQGFRVWSDSDEASALQLTVRTNDVYDITQVPFSPMEQVSPFILGTSTQPPCYQLLIHHVYQVFHGEDRLEIRCMNNSDRLCRYRFKGSWSNNIVIPVSGLQCPKIPFPSMWDWLVNDD